MAPQRFTIPWASEGYPGQYEKNMKISMNIDENDLVFHAGTAVKGDSLYATGGRILNVVGFGDNLKEAIADAYRISDRIEFRNKYFRTDIGQKGLEYK